MLFAITPCLRRLVPASLLVISPVLFAETFQADTSAELIQAMEQSESRPGPDVIVLESDQVYSFSQTYTGYRALPAVTDTLSIEGNNATWRWTGEKTGGFLRINAGGALELHGLKLEEATGTAIIVKGTLDANRCTFSHNLSRRGGALRITPQGQARLSQCILVENVKRSHRCLDSGELIDSVAIYNLGTLTIRASTLAFERKSITLGKFKPKVSAKFHCGFGTVRALLNKGRTRLVNATVIDHYLVNLGRMSLINSTLLSSNLNNLQSSSGQISVGNSLLILGSCPGGIVSLGHNFYTKDIGGCEPALESDRGLDIDTPVVEDVDTVKGLPVFEPLPGSPIIDAGDAELCPATGALGRPRPIDGNGDGGARCDVGAVEFQPGPFEINKRVTGLWHESARDGHYFIIERPRPDFMVVFWATYDVNGDPMWLYGSGSVEGNHTEQLTLYRQSDMRFPSFDRDDMVIEEWGTLQLTFDSCDSAEARWRANDSPALEGSAEISHLAYVEGRECFRASKQAHSTRKSISALNTGTWYDAEHDGHYVSTVVLPDDRGMFALWWTYTLDGKQLWLYGVGQAQSGRMTFAVYESRGMALPELDTTERRSIAWGTITLDFESCKRMILSWQSDQPGFPSGQAEMERLTNRDACSR